LDSYLQPRPVTSWYIAVDAWPAFDPESAARLAIPLIAAADVSQIDTGCGKGTDVSSHLAEVVDRLV
jgi:hypothetical protein